MRCEGFRCIARENRVFQKSFLGIGVRTLLVMLFSILNRLKLRQEMAAATGKKEPVSMSLFLEVTDLKVEDE